MTKCNECFFNYWQYETEINTCIKNKYPNHIEMSGRIKLRIFFYKHDKSSREQVKRKKR